MARLPAEPYNHGVIGRWQEQARVRFNTRNKDQSTRVVDGERIILLRQRELP